MNSQQTIASMTEEEAIKECATFLGWHVTDTDKRWIIGSIIEKLIEWKCWFKCDHEVLNTWSIYYNSYNGDSHKSLFKAFLLTAHHLGKYEPPKPKEKIYYRRVIFKDIFGPYDNEEEAKKNILDMSYYERVRIIDYKEGE